MNIYVGNLPYTITEDEIRDAFEAVGTVSAVSIITDKFSGKSRGFGFVEMKDNNEAEQAISELNGKEISGRALVINEAREKKKDFKPRKSRW